MFANEQSRPQIHFFVRVFINNNKQRHCHSENKLQRLFPSSSPPLIFNSRLPKYDLKSLVDIAICYDNVCNWFNYIETNKISQGDFVAPEHQAVFNQIMTSALDNPIIPQYIRDEYKFYTTADYSGAPNKKVIASDRVTSTGNRMLARWNAYTAKFGVAAKAYPTHGGRKAVEESRSSR